MFINDIMSYFGHIESQLESTTNPEILCAVAAPLLALLVGVRIKRYSASRRQNSIATTLLDYILPLISPAVALLVCAVSISAFKASGLESALLLYMLKICTAWLAFAFVFLMSTKRIAGWFIAIVIIPITLLHLFDVWDITITALESVKFMVGTVELNLYIICRGIVVLILLQWLSSFTVTLVDRRLNKVHDLRASNRALIMKIFQIVLYCFVFLFAMQLLGISLTALGVFGGALGVGIGFGLQKIASNFISGIILLFEKSIEIGDLVELSDGTLGWVRQTYARYTRLEMTNGKEMFIPNEEFISQRVISWTHTNKKAQVEIVLSVGYDSDIALARKLMEAAANAHPSRQPGSEALSYMTAFGDNGIELKMQFWVKDITAGRQAPRSDIMFKILQDFRANNIALPFPQREVRVLNPTTLVEPPPLTPPAKPKAKTNKAVPLKEMP